MARSRTCRTCRPHSKPPPPPEIPFPPIPTDVQVPPASPVPLAHSPERVRSPLPLPPPPPPCTPHRSLPFAPDLENPDSMSPKSTPEVAWVPLLSRTSRSIRRAFSARRATSPAVAAPSRRRIVTTSQIGSPVLQKGDRTMKSLARMGVTLDSPSKGAAVTKAPPGSPGPRKPYERMPHWKRVPGKGVGEGRCEQEAERRKYKRRGFVFGPALEEKTTVEPLETFIAPLRVLGGVEGDDGGGLQVSDEEVSGEEASPSSSGGSPGIFDDPIDRIRWSFLSPPRGASGAQAPGVNGTIGGATALPGSGDIDATTEAPNHDSPAAPVTDRKGNRVDIPPPAARLPVRAPPPIPSKETQVQRRAVGEGVSGFGEKTNHPQAPSLPPLRPPFADAKKKGYKPTSLPPIKESVKRNIPPPLVLRKMGPSRPPNLPPIVIEQVNIDAHLPAPSPGLYAEKRGALSAKGAHVGPQDLQARSRKLQTGAAEIPARIRDPLTGIRCPPPRAPTPPMSLGAMPVQGLSIEEAALKEVLLADSSRTEFSRYLSTKTDGNDDKLLQLWMTANAHAEALKSVAKLAEEVRAIAAQIPFLALEKMECPENIAMAQRKAFRRMVEEFPSYLLSKSKQLEKEGKEQDRETEREREATRSASRILPPQILPTTQDPTEGLSCPRCVYKLSVAESAWPMSPKQRKKKAFPESLGATTSTAQITTTRLPAKHPIPARRRRSMTRVASGCERKVHVASSSQRKLLFPQTLNSRRALHPSIECASLSSPSSDGSEPDLVMDRWSKDSVSDSMSSCCCEDEEMEPYDSQRMSFAFTKDEIIRLSKVLKGENHLKIFGVGDGCRYGGIVEKLLDLGDDLHGRVDNRRDATMGLYDLYDR